MKNKDTNLTNQEADPNTEERYHVMTQYYLIYFLSIHYGVTYIQLQNHLWLKESSFF